MNKLTGPQKNKANQFKEFTSCGTAMAIKALARANWRLEEALDQFFTNPPSPPPPERNPLDSNKILQLFNKYRDTHSSDQVIIWSGIEKLCKDLGVDPNDIIIIVISFHCECKVFSEITLEEWRHGAAELQFDTIEKLKSKLEKLRAELWDERIFKNFYLWVFKYAKEGNARSLDAQSAVELWKLILEDRFKYLKEWCEFVTEVKKAKTISKDTWNQLLEFKKQVQNGIENYDENGAMPVIFDDFVDHVNGTTPDSDDEDSDDL